MKILYISNKPIFPQVDGGCLAMSKFLQLLVSLNFELKHFCIETYKHTYEASNYPEELRNKLEPEAFFVDTKIKILKAFYFLFKKGSYNLYRFKSSKLNQSISNYLKENKVDVIILESIFLADTYQTLRANSDAKIIIRTHNVEFNIWERLAGNQDNWLKKLYLKKLAADLKKEELHLLNQADGVLSITETDKQTFLLNGIKKPIKTIPIAIETSDSEPDYRQNKFYHLGTMNWEPNIEAVQYLIDYIFPKIKAKRPEASLTIAGSNMSEKMKSLKREGVEFVGYISSIPTFLSQAGILLSPIKSGSGVRVKLLESMGYGIPVVTTVLGKEGIEAQNEKDIFFTETEETFINYAVQLHDSESLRRNIGSQAKKLIQEKYSFENIKKETFEFIQDIT
jgi:polysaccharide biosynthesis protein PslH